MTSGAHETLPTAGGRLTCRRYSGDQKIHRVGFAPDPWAWTPWIYAHEGRFTGRWDDPEGTWRTVYGGVSAKACLLEVLAFARRDPHVEAGLAEIDEDPDDAARFPTSVATGQLSRTWCHPRMLTTARLDGCYALPSDENSLSTLRELFIVHAIRLGLADVDASAVRDSKPRELTQAMAAWFYQQATRRGDPLAGVQFQSRHGDGLHLWAVFERADDLSVSSHIELESRSALTPDNAELAEAMRIHRLDWSD